MQTCYYEGSYEEIVQAYIEYYHKRASRCKWFYYSLNTLKIGLVVSIPVLQSIDLTKNCAWILALVNRKKNLPQISSIKSSKISLCSKYNTRAI